MKVWKVKNYLVDNCTDLENILNEMQQLGYNIKEIISADHPDLYTIIYTVEDVSEE